MILSKKGILITSLLFAVLLFTLASCATVGRQFPTDVIQHIQLEKTTKQNITEIFGPPWRIGLEDGTKTWTYGYYKYRLFGESTTYDLVIRFNSKDIVTSYTFNTTEIEEELK
ncbi:hypothetical protein ACFL6H_03585 [Candidatus Latescibacterota bacterium]